MMNEEKRKMYAEASKRAGEIARESHRKDGEELKEKILDVFGEDFKKTWIEDLEALETTEERIKYVLDRKNLMARVFFPEDYKRLKGVDTDAG